VNRASVQLTLASLKMYVRNRFSLFWSLLLPLVILVIFGALQFGGAASLSIGVVDQAHDTTSQQLIASLSHLRGVVMSEGSYGQERAALDDGNRDLVVVLPAGLGIRTQDLNGYYNAGRLQNAQLAQFIVSLAADQISLRAAGASGGLHLTSQGVSSRNLSSVDFLVPGIIAMSIMQTGISGVVFAIVQLKQRGILRRLMATPMRIGDFLFAQVTTRLVVSVLQLVIFLGVGIGLFGLHLAGSLPLAFLVAVMGAAVFISIGFVVSAVARTEETAVPAANLITLPLMFLSGVFFPRTVMPGWLQGITAYLPLTPMVDALRGVMVEGLGFGGVRLDLLGMIVWLAIAALAARRLFRWDVA
jgi:ABC-2 type transport system permease protein